MKIWVDADSCPRPIRDIILRAAQRLCVPAVFVANKPLLIPHSPHISTVLVGKGSDVVDAYIVEHANANDLVVTQDIPLAALLVPQSISVISPRGDRYQESNINEYLANRNLMEELRNSGTITGGPRPFDDKLKRLFANQFDAELHRLLRLGQSL
jgi:uncharacterized protein